MKLKSKIFVSIMLIVSMLFTLNSVYAEKNDQDLSLKIVTTEKIGMQVFNQLINNRYLNDFSKKNKFQLQENLKAIAYVKEKDAYVFYFERVIDDDNFWFVSVVYDKNNRKIIDAVSSDTVNNQSVIRVFEGKSHYLSKQKTSELRNCDDCNNKKSNSTKKTSFLSSLVFDQKAAAAKKCTPEESSKQCGWGTIVMCGIAAFLPFVGPTAGFACAVVSNYVCTEVPVSGCMW